jgi:cell wall-associated NlpC family hydrolase
MELRAPTLFSATLEVRRLSEDGHFRGFWNLRDRDRRGWLVSLGFSFRWGAGPSGSGRAPSNLQPASEAGATYSYSAGEAAPALAGDVVQTALAAMGEPYRWGGTGTDQGFDCSGLVWYAYAEHGVRLPRVSREQARAGRPVPAEVAALRPGDILLFADRPGAVTHVGLYVGEARFIHATTSGGVRIGSLDGSSEVSERWYLSRWVGARRVLD